MYSFIVHNIFKRAIVNSSVVLPLLQKPSSVRIDQLDREQFNPNVITFPIIVHFGIRPAQLSYAGDPQ